jgi:hypothetical protein
MSYVDGIHANRGPGTARNAHKYQTIESKAFMVPQRKKKKGKASPIYNFSQIAIAPATFFGRRLSVKGLAVRSESSAISESSQHQGRLTICR